jgi:hypothetical protein
MGPSGVQEVAAAEDPNTHELVGKHLRLPAGVQWIGKPDASFHLFVRPCYEALFNLVSNTWNQNSWGLLLGTPGLTWRHCCRVAQVNLSPLNVSTH